MQFQAGLDEVKFVFSKTQVKLIEAKIFTFTMSCIKKRIFKENLEKFGKKTFLFQTFCGSDFFWTVINGLEQTRGSFKDKRLVCSDREVLDFKDLNQIKTSPFMQKGR